MTETYLLICPSCGNETPHTLTYSINEDIMLYSTDGDGMPFDLTLLLLKCPTCNKHSLRTNINIEDDEAVINSHVEYPNKIVLPTEIPKEIRTAYLQAERVKHISPNAYAVLMRRILESICVDKKAEGKTLYDQLKFLGTKNVIPPILGDASDILRKIGNIGAHAGEEVNGDLVSSIDSFFNILMDYLYIIPSKINEIKKKLK